jgi:predicted HAD superfamily Cof-like phosphohydrolase
MNPMQKQVEDFHRKFGHPIGETPAFRRPELRAKLILEEAIETAVGILGHTRAAELVRQEFIELNTRTPKDAPDFVEAIDGICDTLYVTVGAAIEFGVDIQPVFDEVHRSNMDKVGGAVRADGKSLKPAGWKPPAILDRLVDQGYMP